MLGDYVKNTYVNGSAPGISADRLNNNEDKTAELDTQTAALNDLVSTKAPSASPTFTGTVALPSTTTINTYTPYHTGNIVLTTTTPTEALANGVQVQVY